MRAEAGRLWARPVGADDAVSALMARNRGLGSYTLADQWRGLGGALLARFGATGQDYTQTLVDDRTSGADDGLEALPPEDRARRMAEILARQTAALDGVATHAPTASLTIQTRSGRSVELSIAVSAGLNGLVGMKVELHTSGEMDADERAAVEQLATGLDRVLEGLGRDDAVNLDLSGLLGYDRQALASVDLSVNNTMTNQVLGSFSLHLGDDKLSVALKGSDGEMHLDVDTDSPLVNAPSSQRSAAVEQMVDRLQRAGDRGRANAALVQQMTTAFKQLQDAAAVDAGDDERTDPAAAAAVDADLAAQASGLADFDAGFGGDTWRSNRSGTTHEAGQVDYQLSQRTTVKAAGQGGRAVEQTVSEHLAADARKAVGVGTMLDVRAGTYSALHVRDSSTVTTLIDAAADGAVRVLRKTDDQQLQTITDFENHHAVRSQSWPVQRSWLARLR